MWEHGCTCLFFLKSQNNCRTHSTSDSINSPKFCMIYIFKLSLDLIYTSKCNDAITLKI
jgi:hypothetical protein